MIRTGTAILMLLLFVQLSSATVEFEDKPFGEFELTQNETFVFDFNATNTSDGSPVAEDGTVIRYDYSNDDASIISSESSFFFNTTSGELTYTPSNADATKNFTILFMIREPGEDGEILDSVTPRFSIENINDPPEITDYTPPPIEAAENETIELNATADDIDAPYGDNVTLSWWVYRGNSSSAPLVFNETDQLSTLPGQSEFEYLVDFCDAPQIYIEAIATDEEGLEDSVNWTADIENVNRPVTFNESRSIANQTFNQSQGLIANFSYYEYFIDPDDLVCDDDELTFTLDGAVNTTLEVNTTSGAVIFNATPGWAGNETVTITAYDEEGENVTSNTFTISVVLMPEAPIGFDPGPQDAYEDAPFELFIRFEDPDLPYGDSLNYTLNDTSLFDVEWHNQSWNASHARIAFTPQQGSAGVYHFNVTASDTFAETADTSVTFPLTINANSPPDIQDPLVLPDATQDEHYEVLLNATDADGDDIFWYVVLNESIDGSLDDSSLSSEPFDAAIGGYPLESQTATQGRLNFTPTNDEVGNHSLTFFAVDERGARSNTTVMLEVINVNDPPENLEPDSELLKAKVGVEWNHTATVEDPDFPWGDFVTITVNDSDITIENTTTDGSAWRMNWTPTSGDVGNRSILLNATDLSGASITAEFTLEILEPLPPQIITPIPGLVAQASVPYETIIHAYDPNDDPLVFSFNESIWGAHATPEGQNRTVINTTYGPSDVGNYTINVTVTDTDGMTDSVIVEFVVEPFNLPPELLDARDISFVAGNTTVHNFTVEDPEDDPWNAFFEDPAFDWLDVTVIDNETLSISATPNESRIGFHQTPFIINQTAFPPRNSTYLFNITVFSDPQAPEITSRSPVNDVNDGIEGASRLFSVTVDDPNFPGPGSNESDRVTLEWTFNDEVVRVREINQTTTDEYLFEYDYCSAPGGELTLTATDLWNLTATTSWNVEIENVNRPPYFGEKRFPYEAISARENQTFAFGPWEFTGLEDLGNQLRHTNASIDGELTSPVLELGRENSINKANITSLSMSGSGTVAYRMRFSSTSTNTNDPSWTGWTNLTTIGTYPGDITPRRYVQIQIVISSPSQTNLTTIENATLNYEFRDQVINSSFTGFDYWFLDDYFTDPDYVECQEGPLNASVEDSPPDIVITIDQLDRSVDVITDTSFGYTHETQFTVFDAESNATSNVFDIEVVERPDQVNIPQPTSGGGGGGGSAVTVITEPEEVEVDTPEPLEIITPGSATIYENETVTIPLSIVNRWNETLENVRLFAESDNDNLSLDLSLEQIPTLASDANETLNLSITSYATFGEYSVSVTATVDDPEFNTTSTILINSIELGQRGTEEYNTRLSFARDIVESNPRCIELNEHIERSRSLVTQGETEEAILLLDDIVENCRYLINLDPATLFPLDERSWFERILTETSSQTQLYALTIIAVNVLLFGMVGVYLFRNR